MLTIQPNFTTKQNYTKPLHFKGESKPLTEEYVNEQKEFFKKQIKEADKILNDKETSETLKKWAKKCKIASKGIIEGWAVLWGATRGAQFAKAGTIKAIQSKSSKAISKNLGRIGSYISRSFAKLAESSFGKKAAEYIEKLDNTKYGNYIVKAAKAIAKGIKKIFGFAKKGTANLNVENIEKTYDKVSKGAARTLGVGSGIAGSYSAVQEVKKAEEKAKVEEEEEAEEASVEEAEEDVEANDIEEIDDIDGGDE